MLRGERSWVGELCRLESRAADIYGVWKRRQARERE